MNRSFDLVVASHLRWSFVWQRPQQLLSRLARHRRVLFVEEPVPGGDHEPKVPSLEEVTPNVFVLAPRVQQLEDGGLIWDDEDSIADQVRLALQLLRFRQRGLWFYTPLPEFLIRVTQPDVVVYDVMDELANFKFAPAGLRAQETRMLRRADVVFTGGASLYESKLPFNRNTHLFASGVDEAHYAKACSDDTRVPDWMEAIPAPRATYIGVIDERMDYDIIDQMAQRRPDIQFVMVGPVVKVDPAALPQAPNLHYVGQKNYQELPGILKGTDVCLMPFAQNDATRFISPTKTLEYMATHRPIVSTAIRDVERFYSDIVYLADEADEFVLQIEAALNESVYERSRRRAQEDRVLAEHAWDAIADSMDRLLENAFAEQVRSERPMIVRPTVRPARIPARPAGAAISPTAGASILEMPDTISGA